MMRKNTIEIYALVICFISLTFASLALAQGIYSSIIIKYPELTIGANVYEQHKDLMKMFGISNTELKKDLNTFSEEDKIMLWYNIHKKYVSALNLIQKSHSQILVQTIIVFFVAMIFLIIH